MGSFTLQPSATIDIGGNTYIGGFAVASLKDDLDSTYLRMPGGATHAEIGPFTGGSVPGSALTKQIIGIARLSAPEDPATFNISIPTLFSQNVTVNWSTPKTVYAFVASDFDDLNAIAYSYQFNIKNTSSGGGGDNDIRLYELSMVVVYVDRPTVTLTAPAEGASLTTTNTPLVQWTPNLDADGGNADQAQVKVFNQTQYGGGGFSPDTTQPVQSSGTSLYKTGGAAAATSWRVADPLPGTLSSPINYRAYVKVRQSAYSNFSDWTLAAAFNTFAEAVNPAPVPSAITVTPEAGQIRINVTTSASSPSSDVVEIQRSLDGGTTWAKMRTFGSPYIVPSASHAIAVDAETPNGTNVRYRARAGHNYSGSYAFSTFITSATTSWSDPSWWVKHPMLPELNMRVLVRSQATYTRTARQGVHQPLGNPTPIVVTDGVRSLPSGEMTFRLDSATVQDAFDAVLDADAPILVQAPPSMNWPDRWLRFSDQTRERVQDQLARPHVFDTLPWQEVESPDRDDDAATTTLPDAYLFLSS